MYIVFCNAGGYNVITVCDTAVVYGIVGSLTAHTRVPDMPRVFPTLSVPRPKNPAIILPHNFARKENSSSRTFYLWSGLDLQPTSYRNGDKL